MTQALANQRGTDAFVCQHWDPGDFCSPSQGAVFRYVTVIPNASTKRNRVVSARITTSDPESTPLAAGEAKFRSIDEAQMLPARASTATEALGSGSS
jgi:hypothetical protein